MRRKPKHKLLPATAPRWVQLNTTRVITRVGYPLGVKDAKAALDDTALYQRTVAFLQSLDLLPLDNLLQWTPVPDGKVLHEISNAVYRQWLVDHNHGGNTRSIHYEEIPELQGQIVPVIEQRRAITGIRCPGSRSADDDYEPAHLAQQTHHTLYLVQYVHKMDWERVGAERDWWQGKQGLVHREECVAATLADYTTYQREQQIKWGL